MKHKTSKRSHSNKQHNHHQRLSQTRIRRLSNISTTVGGSDDLSTISTKNVDLGIGTAHLDSHTPCLKANLTVKSQKLLKRDLLRCTGQRPSLLGSQTLQPPRIRHGTQQTTSMVSPSSTSSSVERHPRRRRSLSLTSNTFYATIDRIGPWPDISISRLRSDGNELLRPLKNFRNLKNPRLFSPKYYAALSDNASKFTFHNSTRSYIEEYRKQKGYLLDPRVQPQRTSLSSSSILTQQQSEDDQLSVVGTISTAGASQDRSILSTTDLSLLQTRSTNDLNEYTGTSPSIPAVVKHLNEPQQPTSTTNFPSILMRNGHLRPTRHPPHHGVSSQQQPQTITLPSVTTSSLHYASSINQIEKAYAEGKKLAHGQSKLYLIDGRPKKRPLHGVSSDTEITTSGQDYPELRAASSSMITTGHQPGTIVVYQMSRRPALVTSQSDVGSLS